MGVCVGCGTPIDEPLPISRQAHCKKCTADFHACRQCYWYDTHVAKQCREPMADWVADKEKANFCDYFKLNEKKFVTVDDRTESAKEALEKLFKK
ncbi:MAG: hypothetical protein COV45_07490 [Deltaproteobacteria bacterium CG11_big_fil_rev_8_21_14_0_20_47_16]|nr:MAG: hypothetical protein COV45_07490 [Deltaproteobacteria bacterium CG11_big_fil_rev_8_21_14_0_20_47_16]